MLCKVCSTDLGSAKGERRNLLGKAAGINTVYATLFDAIHQACPDDPAAEIHKYLGSETSFVCRGCFTVFKKYSELKEELDDLMRKLKVSYTAVSVSWSTSYLMVGRLCYAYKCWFCTASF